MYRVPHPTGILWDLSPDEYQRGPGVSRSTLARMLEKSPHHVHELELGDFAVPPPVPTPAMAAGTLLHCVLLEPGAFAKRYAVGPEVKTKAVKAWKDFEAQNAGLECITPLQHEVAQAQAAKLRATPMGSDSDDGTFGDLLDGARFEASCFWTDEPTGLLCKCRPDVLAEVGSGDSRGWIIPDVKTTSSAKPERFARSLGDFAYDMQAAYYSVGVGQATGLPVLSFLFACVEAEYPFATALYVLPEEWVAYGWQRCRDALNLYAECQRTGVWPGYGVGVMQLAAPKWHPINRKD
jgi:PDDEXK-like domain of unknown function (DUF3799)